MSVGCPVAGVGVVIPRTVVALCSSIDLSCFFNVHLLHDLYFLSVVMYVLFTLSAYYVFFREDINQRAIHLLVDILPQNQEYRIRLSETDAGLDQCYGDIKEATLGCAYDRMSVGCPVAGVGVVIPRTVITLCSSIDLSCFFNVHLLHDLYFLSGVMYVLFTLSAYYGSFREDINQGAIHPLVDIPPSGWDYSMPIPALIIAIGILNDIYYSFPYISIKFHDKLLLLNSCLI